MLGYGRMGREVELNTPPRGHTVVLKIDRENTDTLNRRGFAVGALLAAEFIAVRKGVFSMSDVLGL